MGLFVTFIRFYFRAGRIQFVLGYGPYEQRVVFFHFQAAAVGQRLVLGLTFKSFVPAFQVVQAEAFHVEFLYAFLFDDIHCIFLVHGGGTSVRGIACRTEHGYVASRLAVVGMFLLYIRLCTDKVLFRQAEHFRHADVEDVVIDERFVAEIFNQQRPGKSVAVSGGEALEVSGDTQVVQVVQVDNPFCRYIVGTYAAVVVVGEYLSQRAAVGIVMVKPTFQMASVEKSLVHMYL